jgi:hypothetical protein
MKMDIRILAPSVCLVCFAIWLNEIHTQAISWATAEPQRLKTLSPAIISRPPVGRTTVTIEVPGISHFTGLLVTNRSVWSYDGLAREWVEISQTNDTRLMITNSVISLTNLWMPHVRPMVITNWVAPHTNGMILWWEILDSIRPNAYETNKNTNSP